MFAAQAQEMNDTTATAATVDTAALAVAPVDTATVAATAQQTVKPDTLLNGDKKESPQHVHEISAYAGCGVSKLSYSLREDGRVSGDYGFELGVGYTFNISESVGLTTGLEMTNYGSQANYTEVSGRYDAIDDLDKPVDFRFVARDYREQQSLYLLSIPVKVQFRTPIVPRIDFFAAGGFKVGIPLSASAEISQTLTTSGYYDYYHTTFTDLPEHNYYTNLEINGSESKPDFGFTMLMSLEAGARFTLSDKTGLYLGAYFDYGLTDLRKTSNKHLVEYNRKLTYESVLNTALADKVSLMNVGVKVRISMLKH
jgi:hypothetical protein